MKWLSVRFFIFLWAASFLFISPAHCLTTSENALRIEDKKEGNVLLGADSAVVEVGELYRTIVLVWGNLEVRGEVEEIVVLSGHVVFHDGAVLKKSLVVMGGSFETNPGAKVATDQVLFQAPGPLWRVLQSFGNLWQEHFNWVARLIGAITSSLILWLLTWGLFRIFPRLQQTLLTNFLQDWWKNLIVGILGSLLVLPLMVLLIISIFGILVLPLYFLMLFAAGILSYITACFWAGHRLLPAREGQQLRPISIFIGIVVMHFFWVVGVWWAFLPGLLLWTLAWGSLLRSLRALWR